MMVGLTKYPIDAETISLQIKVQKSKVDLHPTWNVHVLIMKNTRK